MGDEADDHPADVAPYPAISSGVMVLKNLEAAGDLAEYRIEDRTIT
jgi:hypothetical protein